MSNTLQPHGLQHARTPCLSPTPRVYSNSCPLSQWCHITISSSAVPLSSLLQSFPASGLFQMNQLFALGSKVLEFQSIGVHLQGKPFNITVIQVNVLTSNAEEAEVERFYEDLHDLLELTLHKKGPLHCRGLECKRRKSRNTWSHRQIWPWSTEWSRAKANRVLPREHIGHSKLPLPTTQEKTLHMDITRWSIPKSDWLYSLQPKMEKLYTVSKNKTGSWLWLRSWTPYCQIQT